MASSAEIIDIELREELSVHSAAWIHSGSLQVNPPRHAAYQCIACGCPDRFAWLMSLGIGYTLDLDPEQLLAFIFRCPHRRPQFNMIEHAEIARIAKLTFDNFGEYEDSDATEDDEDDDDR